MKTGSRLAGTSASFRIGRVTVLAAATLIWAVVAPAVGAQPLNRDIRALYKGESAFELLQSLTDFGPRVAGGAAEREAAEHIAAVMHGYGLDVEIQEFPALYFDDLGSALTVIGGVSMSTKTLLYSPPGRFTTAIVNCGLGYPDDFPPDVAGGIALMRRGALDHRTKTQNAAAAGAVAAVIYNDRPGNYLATLGSPADIPALAISLEEGSLLVDLLATGPVTADLDVETVVEVRASQNVIGTLEGLDPDQGIVYMGGHYDSVRAGPGANDNASGTAALLEAARVLATRGHRTKATLKFIAFGAEEIGLVGSYTYVRTHWDEVTTRGIGMINLDMLGVGDWLYVGCIGWGGMELTDYTGDKAEAWALGWRPFWASANSDHTYFEWAGVPSVFLIRWPDPWYHTRWDTPDKIDITALEQNGELATATMYEWAKNPVLRSMKAERLRRLHVFKDEVYAAK